MIKEIKFPYPAIYEKITDTVKFFRKKGKYKHRYQTYDYIGFDRDYTFVEEFAEFCGINEDLAEEVLRVFFDEIKQNLLKGNQILLYEFGKFVLTKRCYFHFIVNYKIKYKMNEIYGCGI